MSGTNNSKKRKVKRENYAHGPVKTFSEGDFTGYKLGGSVKIIPRNSNQNDYLNKALNPNAKYALLAYGPAGTGRTFLSVAVALLLKEADNSIDRIVAMRPAVDADESIGFLPGDVNEKIAVYLRPIWDVLVEIKNGQNVENLIEMEPIGFLRGRTFHNTVIILDEAQNTTVKQMKMFMSRIGEGSIILINGDVEQSDLKPVGIVTGLDYLLAAVAETNLAEGMDVVTYTSDDVERSEAARFFIKSFEEYDAKHA